MKATEFDTKFDARRGRVRRRLLVEGAASQSQAEPGRHRYTLPLILAANGECRFLALPLVWRWA